MRTRRLFSRFARVSGSLVLACMVTVVAGCAEDVKDIRTEGIHQFRNHQHIESMATLRYALRKEPNDAECNYYMGLNYRALAERRFQEGDLPAAKRTLDVALFYFTQAVKSWPNYMAAVQAKTEALASRGKYDSALSVAETVADNNRGVADHFVFLGDEYRARADYDNALRAYKTALASDPQNARAYAGMARLYWQVGDRELAVDTFTRAHELNPAEPDAAEALAELEHSGESHMAAPLPRVLPPQEPSGSGTSRIYSGE